MSRMEADSLPVRDSEVWWVLGYFAVYLVYHTAIAGESDRMHWMGLVGMPVVLLLVLRKAASGRFSPRTTLRSIGLRRENLKTGVGWAVGLGLGISVLQSLQRFDETMELVVTGKVLYLYPLVLIILFLTAGFTEEVFFRGVLQTRLERLLGSTVGAIGVTSVLFSVYHIPYTYLNPNWPSAGNLGAAVQAAFVNGTLGGVVLGILYVRTKHNLVSTIIVHSLINSIPAMTMIRFGG